MRKFLVSTLCIVLCFSLSFSYAQHTQFNTHKAAYWLEQNSGPASKTCCAWFVMRAMQQGNIPAIILPAWAYKYYLPSLGFEPIKNYDINHPKVGDIYVYQRAGTSKWGHIAMWTGKHWCSDFKQHKICVSSNYKNETPVFFRHRNIVP